MCRDRARSAAPQSPQCPLGCRTRLGGEQVQPAARRLVGQRHELAVQGQFAHDGWCSRYVRDRTCATGCSAHIRPKSAFRSRRCSICAASPESRDTVRAEHADAQRVRVPPAPNRPRTARVNGVRRTAGARKYGCCPATRGNHRTPRPRADSSPRSGCACRPAARASGRTSPAGAACRASPRAWRLPHRAADAGRSGADRPIRPGPSAVPCRWRPKPDPTRGRRRPVPDACSGRCSRRRDVSYTLLA